MTRPDPTTGPPFPARAPCPEESRPGGEEGDLRALRQGSEILSPGGRAEEGRIDQRLVARFQAGEEEVFSELLDRYQGRVFRLIRRMWARERETAEDLCQEVFLRLYRGLPGFQGESAFSTWVHRITINVCITEIRSRRALKRDRPTLSLDQPLTGSSDGDGPYLEPASRVPDPPGEVERRELFESCRNAIEDLPSLWRVILTLRDIEGRSYEEIAEILDLPIGTVRSRLHRARARVRDLLEEGRP